MPRLMRLDFEVFGHVQGVYFRQNTKDKAKAIGLKGWCMNTKNKTVVGQLEGEETKVDEMKHWLERIGSPNSSIEKAEFRHEEEIDNFTFADFQIKKTK